MARRKRRDEGASRGAHWMDTYGDMVTLLLTFFVLLFAFSTVSQQKWEALIKSFSIWSGGDSIIGDESANSKNPISSFALGTPSPKPTSSPAVVDVSPLYNEIAEYVKENGLDAKVEVTKTEFEIIIRFKDNIMFDSGKADLKPEAITILDNVSNVLNKYVNEIKMVRIEGHTDNRPIHTSKFPSNWELSTSRAVEVLRYLIEKKNFDSGKISAVGYGEYHPIATNATEEGRSKNRRVDFVISRAVKDDSQS